MFEGIGTDIIETQRIQEAIDRHGDRFLERLFTDKERNYCSQYAKSLMHYAGRFAAKEAIFKALGTGIRGEFGWKDVEIINNELGKPEVFLSLRLKKQFPRINLFLSISHCKDYATATAIAVST